METETPPVVEVLSPDVPNVGRSQFERWGLTSQDLLVLCAGVLFAAGTGPFMFGGWTPRMAALLAGLPLGVVLIFRLARARDKASIAALAFLGWASIGAFASGAPWQSLVGRITGNTQSVLIFAGVFGYWALARTLSDRGRALVGPVLAAGLAASVLVGLGQVLFKTTGGAFALVDGRASGLEGNSAYFSMTVCGAYAWCASMSESAESSRLRRMSLGGVAFFAMAIGLSGSRASMIVLGLVCVAVCLRARTVRSIGVAVAAVLGFGTSLAIQHAVHLSGATDRFSSGTSGGRMLIWKAAISGFADRPLLGWGVGRVRPAFQHHLTAEFVRRSQRDDILEAWYDVHNVVVQMLVTVGIVGVVLLAVFVAFALRKSDFGLALAAIAISVNWLLQPSTISSLSIAAIFLGASAPRIARAAPHDMAPVRWPRVVTASAVTIGLMSAFALVAADLNLRQAARSGDHAAVRSAAAWFGDDPYILDNFVMDSYQAGDAVGRAERTKVALREIAAEPDVARWWNELAMTQWDSGDLDGMRASIDKALSMQPNHVRSWVQMTAYAKRVGDSKLAATAQARACELGGLVCQPG